MIYLNKQKTEHKNFTVVDYLLTANQYTMLYPWLMTLKHVMDRPQVIAQYVAGSFYYLVSINIWKK
jgi:hypothetical protein